MLYNKYNNISEKDFSRLKIKLWNIEPEVEPVVAKYGFEKQKRPDENDFIAISYYLKENEFEGAVGLAYMDIPGPPTFSLGYIKVYDENGRRYSKRGYVVENKPIEFFETNAVNLFIDAVKIYFTIKKEDIIDFITLPPSRNPSWRKSSGSGGGDENS